ncbi:NAD(P)-dependent dehydrogenase (short-subunit alcohol dehydrogenase family) [Rheinheimera pacifica]|uniref:SDR family oxidoreductase n=1 Tax=Rheinheimera pacifica TaxID=173990 RepID=UPI00285D2186|nr:SDR family oxidoreductase [Rheinheimera pacifica]MDR6981787.1 NAD(P)-dependent dehydrogenase (short-subunit alcohol dehydrogenase family) [Rheinheimera pacifica]
MTLSNAVVFITGANRGIGLEFAKQALARGARKVYAAARNPDTITLDSVLKVRLDVTDAAQVAAIPALYPDVTVLVNNAGIARFGGFMDEGSEQSAYEHFETNFFGPLRLTKALAPVLAANGGGAILNVLSVVSWLNAPALAPYGASKSAAWALTNGLRLELAAQGTQVTALHMGFVDTDLTSAIDAPKAKAADIVASAYDGLAAKQQEVLADELTQQVKQALSTNSAHYLTGDR